MGTRDTSQLMLHTVTAYNWALNSDEIFWLNHPLNWNGQLKALYHICQICKFDIGFDDNSLSRIF